MKKHLFIFFVCAALGACQHESAPPHNLEMTYNRGAQLLAAGSPKSAIPYLTQTISSAPDGPEPLALLSLAYALDLQSDLALQEAKKVHRRADEAPGWEAVAVGIADTVLHRSDPAIASLRSVLAAAAPDSPMVPATLQWLALAQIVRGDHLSALETLDKLSQYPSMRATSMLWSLLIRSNDGQSAETTRALIQCAKEISVNFHTPKLDGTPDDQTLYDTGIAAIAAGKIDRAAEIFNDLQTRDTNTGDASLWLALIDASQGRWQDGRNIIIDASEKSSIESRGLANELCAVIRAMEDRPESMIQHMLEGQRLMDKGNNARVVEQPKADKVWFSDSIK